MHQPLAVVTVVFLSDPFNSVFWSEIFLNCLHSFAQWRPICYSWAQKWRDFRVTLGNRCRKTSVGARATLCAICLLRDGTESVSAIKQMTYVNYNILHSRLHRQLIRSFQFKSAFQSMWPLYVSFRNVAFMDENDSLLRLILNFYRWLRPTPLT